MIHQDRTQALPAAHTLPATRCAWHHSGEGGGGHFAYLSHLSFHLTVWLQPSRFQHTEVMAAGPGVLQQSTFHASVCFRPSPAAQPHSHVGMGTLLPREYCAQALHCFSSPQAPGDLSTSALSPSLLLFSTHATKHISTGLLRY